MDEDTLSDEDVRQIIAENECLIADGLDHAIIGVTAGSNVQAVYSCAKIVQQYMLDGMEAEEALEYLEYNVLGGVPGADNAPVFLWDI